MTTKVTIKLAEALLRRKELQQKVDQLRQIQANALFEVKFQRKAVSDSVDDLIAHVPKLLASQVTAEYDYYAKQLRLVDAAIQQANWTCDLSVDHDVLQNYSCKTA